MTAATRKTVNASVRFKIWRRDGFRCTYCGRDAITMDLILEAHHVLPVINGGSDDLSNLVTACRPCHRKQPCLERVRHSQPFTRANEDDVRTRIVEHLVTRHNESGLTHRQFASRLGISETHWWHIRERGTVSIPVLRLAVIAFPDLALRVINEMTEAVA